MKVSVGMITYNMAKYIEEALRSVLCQKEYIDELVICDDASTDDTVSKAKSILENSGFDGWKIVENEHNLGNRKNAIKCYSECCTGDVIIVADPDDIAYLDRFKTLLEPFSDPDVCMAFSDATVFFDDDTQTFPLWKNLGVSYDEIKDQDGYNKKILKKFVVSGCTMAFTKQLVQSCRNVNEKCAWDMWLAWNAPFFGKCVAINRELVKYRQHGNNDSGTASKKTGGRFGRLKKISKCIKSPIKKWFFDTNLFGACLVELKDSLPDTNEDIKAGYLYAIDFYRDILSLDSLKKSERAKILKKVRNNGSYAIYRGGKTQYRLDRLNVLLH